MDGYRRTQAPAGCIVKIDAEGAALNILSQAENMSCRKIVMAAYHFPMEKVQVSMRLRDLGFKTEIKHMRASIYRNPINLSVPIVLAGKILNVLGFIFCFLAYWFLLTATFSF